MKYSILVFASILILRINAQEISFFNGSWQEALEQSQLTQKSIFLDAYTTWCRPCKQLDKTTFKDAEVAKYFNEHFINVKMDMEKGEGIELAEKYDVIVYPTLLFTNHHGEMVHRSAGFHNVEQLLELAHMARGEENLSALDEMYNNGNRDPDFLIKYATARYEIQDGSHEKVAEEYLKTEADWMTEDNKEVIFQYVLSAESTLFDHLIYNRSAYAAMFGKAAVDKKIDRLVNSTLYPESGMAAPEVARAIFTKLNPTKVDELMHKYQMSYHRSKGDRTAYASAAVNYLEDYDVKDWDELNEIGWTFYTVIEDESLLKKAVKWTKESIKLEDNFYNHDTMAALLFKLGKHKKAEKYALKALNYAGYNGIEADETEALLKKIQSSM